MTRALFFRMVLRKLSEITNNKPIFSQYNIFYNYEYFFFQSAFWSLFSHRQRSQSNQEQCSLCCSSPCFGVLLCTHYGPLQCFSKYFRKLKKSKFYGPSFETMLTHVIENYRHSVILKMYLIKISLNIQISSLLYVGGIWSIFLSYDHSFQKLQGFGTEKTW